MTPSDATGAEIHDDAVAALVDAARRDGQAFEDRALRRARVREVDFTRPAKFTTEQERRITRVLDTFCRTASTRLAADLRMPIELELVGLSQLIWAIAHSQVPERAISATVKVAPADTRLLLCSDLPIVLAAIERLLGGGGDQVSVPERRLTDIDWVMAELFLTRVVSQLSVVFEDAAGFALSMEALESHRDTEQLAGVSEPTLAASIEVRHDGTTSTIAMLLPYAAFAPMADGFAHLSVEGEHAEASAAIEAVLADVDVAVHAEVATVELPIESVLALRPGDVLTLERPASAGVTLAVGGVPVCAGLPGRAGPRRAVQVTEVQT